MGDKKECQVETETEEMETPQARRITNPVPSPPPKVAAGWRRWWSLQLEERKRLEKEWLERRRLGKVEVSEREMEDLTEGWERK